MEQTGEYEIAASRELVWEGLNDPQVLAACIPGCQSMERTSDHAFTARVKARIGPVSATFDAALELQDLNPPASYTIVGGVKGGAAGFGKGQAQVQLAEAGPNTLLSYQVSASVGGKLAQIGSRLVDGAARKMADDFFAAFRDRLSAAPDADPSQTPAEPVEQNSAADQSSQDDETRKDETRKFAQDGSMMIWIVAFAVLALAMILAV